MRVLMLVVAGGCRPTPAVLEPQTPALPFSELVARYPGADLQLGRRVFLRQCSVCHQAGGTGTGSAIPPLWGHVPALAQHAEGRTYLAQLVLYGLSGPIEVKGRKFHNAMPALGGMLQDDEAAAVLNYALVSWGNHAYTEPAALMRPQDIARLREPPRNGRATHARRLALWPQGVPRLVVAVAWAVRRA
jgi:mono/diheme cytochrome c family protein